MRTDPKPNDAFARFDAQRTMREPDSYRPVLTDTLELQRRVTRIGFE